MIPQKQGTAQFIGSSRRGCIVSLAWAGSNVSSGVSVAVEESVSVGKLTILDGVTIGVAIVVTVAEFAVELTGAHPAKATAIAKRESKDRGLIMEVPDRARGGLVEARRAELAIVVKDQPSSAFLKQVWRPPQLPG